MGQASLRATEHLWRTCESQLENWALSVTNMAEMVALQMSVFQAVRVKAMSASESSVHRGTKNRGPDKQCVSTTWSWTGTLCLHAW